MKKLKLEPESLNVQSFEPEAADERRGTAVAYAAAACSPQMPCEPTDDAVVYTCDPECYDPTIWQTE